MLVTIISFCLDYESYRLAASVRGISAVCFPALSTGAHFFDPDDAARIAILAAVECCRELRQRDVKMSVVFCCYTEADLEIYKNHLKLV